VGISGLRERRYRRLVALPLSSSLVPSLSPVFSLLSLPQSSLMDLADVFTAPAPPPASDPWGGPASMATAVTAAAPASDPWGGPSVPPAADPWGGPAPTPASGDPWRPAAPAGSSVDPWGGTPAPAAGEGPTSDPWGSSDGERHHPLCCSLLGSVTLLQLAVPLELVPQTLWGQMSWPGQSKRESGIWGGCL
jgi:hypothetical protein